MDRVLGLLFALLVTLSALLAADLRERTWRSFVAYTSPYLTSIPVGEPGPARSRRVIMVVVRGLNSDEAAAMPALDTLRRRGAEATLTLNTPTYAATTWLTLLSGADPEIHGGIGDAAARTPTLDTLFERVSGSGSVGTLLAAESIIQRLTPGPQLNDVLDASDRSAHDAGVVAAIGQTLRLPNAPERLIVAEFALLDEPRSPNDEAARRMALAATDIRIEAVAGSIDLNTDTLVIVADRGRASSGREGGDEPDVARVPLVLVGAGVARGAQTLGAGRDVAPTIAMLLGIPIPVHAGGVPLWDLIDSRALLVSARQLTTFYEAWAETIAVERFAAELLRSFEADLAAGNLARFSVWHASLMQKVSDARNAALDREQSTRLPVAVAIALALVVAVSFVLDQNAQPPLIGALVFFAALVADAVLLYRLTPSLSLFDQDGGSAVLALLQRDASLLYVVAGTIAALVAAFVCESFEEALLATMGTFVVIIAASAGPALFAYLRWGDAFGLFLPDRTVFVWSRLALQTTTALNYTIVEGWPPAPTPLLTMLSSFVVWNIFGGRVTRA